jgi:hypothetical protein
LTREWVRWNPRFLRFVFASEEGDEAAGGTKSQTPQQPHSAEIHVLFASSCWEFKRGLVVCRFPIS